MQDLICLSPIFNSESKVLLLGTFPSPKSRQAGMYFSHPQNRFWKVLSKVLEQNVPNTNEEKINFLLKNHIALYDVCHSCSIVGASDNTITNVKQNDFSFFKDCKIKQIFVLGNKAAQLYKKNFDDNFILLPSTSPANCAIKMEDLIDKFKKIKEYL